MEEETPEAQGEEGRPSPSAWVRGRGVRLEAALGAPMGVQLARRLGRAFLRFTSAPGPPRARPIKHLGVPKRPRPLAPAQDLQAANTKISIWVLPCSCTPSQPKS